MARAAFLLSATNSAAWSTVRLPSWLITDITMSIIICRRRILRCSSIFSWGDWVAGGELSVWREDSSLRSDSRDPIRNTLPPDFNESYTGTGSGPTQKAVWLPSSQWLGGHRVPIQIEGCGPQGVGAKGSDLAVLQAIEDLPFGVAIGVMVSHRNDGIRRRH